MRKKQAKRIIIEIKPPGFAERLNEIFSITGKNVDFSMVNKPLSKRRFFEDEKRSFKETEQKKKGAVVAEQSLFSYSLISLNFILLGWSYFSPVPPLSFFPPVVI